MVAINPSTHPLCCHNYVLNSANYNSATKSFPNLAGLTQLRSVDYAAIVASGVNPTFSTFGATEGTIFAGAAGQQIKFRNLALGVGEYFVRYRVATGGYVINKYNSIVGSGAVTSVNTNWNLSQFNATIYNRHVGGTISQASSLDTLHTLNAWQEHSNRRMAISIDGASTSFGSTISRSNYYQHPTNETWIGHASHGTWGSSVRPEPFAGWIAQVAVFSRELDTTTRAGVVEYFASLV